LLCKKKGTWVIIYKNSEIQLAVGCSLAYNTSETEAACFGE